MFPADHNRLVNGQSREQRLSRAVSGAEQVILLRVFREGFRRVGVPDKGEVHSGQRLLRRCQNILRHSGGAGLQKFPIAAFPAENCHRVHLPAQFSGQEQRKQVAAENGGFFRLFPQKPPLFGRRAETQGGGFQFPDRDPFPHFS